MQHISRITSREVYRNNSMILREDEITDAQSIAAYAQLLLSQL